MGQPKFPRKKYDTPNHPWQGDRIKEENEVRKKFGLKNKREIWKAQSRLRSIRGQARELISRTRNPDDTQAAQEAKLLLVRLHREGYVGQDATLGDVLGMDVERILNRRLQSQVYLKGMARTPNQARQFVSHGLVTIGERRVTVPSYVVRREEEDLLTFHPNASVADPSHPVRPRAPGQDVVEAAQAAPAVVEETRAKAPVEETKAETAEVEAAPAPAVVEEPEATEEAKAEAPAKAEAAPVAPAVAEEPKAEPEAAKAAPEAVEEPKAEETKEAAAETVEEAKAEESKETAPAEEAKPETAEPNEEESKEAEATEEPTEASETTETETKEAPSEAAGSEAADTEGPKGGDA